LLAPAFGVRQGKVFRQVLWNGERRAKPSHLIFKMDHSKLASDESTGRANESEFSGIHCEPSRREIQFIREGHGMWTVNGRTFEGGPGNIFLIKADEIHSFKAIDDSPLVELDVHLNPRFIQEEPIAALP
jgi:mannose-6-phosphate isomerase-like protein (cupin superfamily)